MSTQNPSSLEESVQTVGGGGGGEKEIFSVLTFLSPSLLGTDKNQVNILNKSTYITVRTLHLTTVIQLWVQILLQVFLKENFQTPPCSPRVQIFDLFHFYYLIWPIT